MNEAGPIADEPAPPRVDRRERRRRRRRRTTLRWVVRLLALGAAFVVGLAIGRALEDAPRPGGTQTLVRTLEPATIGRAGQTVTVTVSGG